jgi:integrase
VQTFTVEEVEAIAAELGPQYRPMIRFAAATGLRPEEWAALERQDIDRRAGVVRVARTLWGARTRSRWKRARSRLLECGPDVGRPWVSALGRVSRP